MTEAIKLCSNYILQIAVILSGEQQYKVVQLPWLICQVGAVDAPTCHQQPLLGYVQCGISDKRPSCRRHLLMKPMALMEQPQARRLVAVLERS